MRGKIRTRFQQTVAPGGRGGSQRRPILTSEPAFRGEEITAAVVLIVVASIAIYISRLEYAPRAVCFLSGTTFFGLWLCGLCARQANDHKLRILGYLWVAKLAFCLLLLFWGWLPELAPGSTPDWGYDPQRFYEQAWDLTQNGWSTAGLQLNYVGILYYYGGLFLVFGHNPITPLLANSLVTLVATLYVVKAVYEIKVTRGGRDWLIGLTLLLPELLWYDVMTSRETLVAALLIVVLITCCRIVAGIGQFNLKNAAVISVCLGAIGAIRTSIILAIALSVLLMLLLTKAKDNNVRASRVYLAVYIFSIMAAASLIGGVLGSTNQNLIQNVQSASASEAILDNADLVWNDNSVGRALLPKNGIEIVLFLPIRMLLYLFSPLPTPVFTLSGLLGRSWIAWQSLISTAGALINAALFPYVLTSAHDAIKNRRLANGPLLLHLVFWPTLGAVAGGNLIIQERYRIMAILPMCACAWLGWRTGSRNTIIRMWGIWLIMGSSVVGLYIARKFF